jgi:hypothetical protein
MAFFITVAISLMPERQKYTGMRPAGGTALLDMIDRAIGMLTPYRVAGAIQVISDAGDNYSRDTIDRRQRSRYFPITIFLTTSRTHFRYWR